MKCQIVARNNKRSVQHLSLRFIATTSLTRHNRKPKINTAEVVSDIQSGPLSHPLEHGPDLSPRPRIQREGRGRHHSPMDCGAQFRDRHTVDHKFFLRCCSGYMQHLSGSTPASAMTPKLKLSLSWLVRASAALSQSALARLKAKRPKPLLTSPTSLVRN